MDIPSVLHELASRTGLDELALDAERRCSICFDEEHTITFEHNPDDGALLLYAVIGSEPGLREAQTARALLEASLLGAQTDGAAFGLDARTGEALLWKRLDEYFVTYSAFEQAVNRFLVQVIHWKEALSALAAAPEEEANASPQIPLLGIRV